MSKVINAMVKNVASTSATVKKEGVQWHEFDILAAVVSRCQNGTNTSDQLAAGSPDYRVSCHRCGNIRKRRQQCSAPSCPHTYCGRCSEKMKEEFGADVFVNGCPVCKDLCCCSNKTVSCNRHNHCYRKCPYTKSAAYRSASVASTPTRRSGAALVGEKRGVSKMKTSGVPAVAAAAAAAGSVPPLPLKACTGTPVRIADTIGGSSGSIFDLLAAMADIDQQQQIAAACLPCSAPMSHGFAASAFTKYTAFSDAESDDVDTTDDNSEDCESISPLKKHRPNPSFETLPSDEDQKQLSALYAKQNPSYAAFYRLDNTAVPVQQHYAAGFSCAAAGVAIVGGATQRAEAEAALVGTDPNTAASAMHLLALAGVAAGH